VPEEPTVVIGLDGAHFELIDRWLDQDKLPNIKKLVDNGVSGDLESVLPPTTSPNWKAYTTGKNPGKIGIYWWENIDMSAQRVYYPADRKQANTEFWEILADVHSVGILGIPTTYPPKSVDGFVVAGAPDAAENGYARPKTVEKDLEEFFDYQVTKRHRLKDDTEAAAEEIINLIDSRFKSGKHLFEEYDPKFLQITTFYLNSLHHYLWDHDLTLEAWQVIDAHLADFVDSDYNIVLMSDHGSNEIDIVFHVNTWLEQEGYITLDSNFANAFQRLGLTTDSLIRLTTALGIRKAAERLAPGFLIDILPNEQGEVTRERKANHINWDNTQAFASGQGPIYIAHDDESPEYDDLREELIQSITNLSGPSGESIIDDIYRGEDIYQGGFIDDAPDLVIQQADNVHIHGGVGREQPFTGPENEGWRAENKRSGLFVACGPSFSKGTIDAISILDLAPTLLHLHDCEIPADMDGTVIKSVFADNTDPAHRDVSVRSETRKEAEIRRIRRAVRQIQL